MKRTITVVEYLTIVLVTINVGLTFVILIAIAEGS